jgi:hypothetical protein
MRRVGASTGFSPALYSKQMGDVAVFKGLLVGKQGGYSLRMVRDGATWKADWLSASTALTAGTSVDPGNNSDAILQDFAATAVTEAICDKDALGKDERIAVVAAGLTPALRKAWAEPFEGDKAKGYDYNPAKLGQKMAEIGNGAESVSFAPQGNAAFKAEITKAGGAKSAYLVKLAKGTTPGQWLVESITPQ